MRTNLNTPLNKELKDNVTVIAKKFGVTPTQLVRDTLENFMPFITVPDEFLTSSGLFHILPKGVPIRAILPFTASMLGYNMVDEFTINLNGNHVKINPYPEYSMLCGIKIIERLYQTIRGNENA